MKSIEHTFSDNEGNHLLVALYFCDNDYKRNSLHIPEEYIDIEIVDIDITKVYVEKPIHFGVFFRMSSWLLMQFEKYDKAVFNYICSMDDLNTNHSELKPQIYRWNLFDRLYQRLASDLNIRVQDVVVGPSDYQSMGRAFYRDSHAPVIHVVAAYLQEKYQ